jgi:hypothetical protein
MLPTSTLLILDYITAAKGGHIQHMGPIAQDAPRGSMQDQVADSLSICQYAGFCSAGSDLQSPTMGLTKLVAADKASKR